MKKTTRRTKVPKKLGRPKASDNTNTIHKIVRSFIDLTYAEGVSALTLQKVATQSGVSFGTVRHHFNAKDRDLEKSAVTTILEEAYSFIESSIFEERKKTNFNPLKAYMNAMFKWLERAPESSCFLVYYFFLASTQQNIPIPGSVFWERGQMRVTALLNESVGMGLYKRPQNFEATALHIHSLITGTCLIALTSRSKNAIQEQLKLTLKSLDVFLVE